MPSTIASGSSRVFCWRSSITLAVAGLLVAAPASAAGIDDCNNNGVPDAAEIAEGLVDDCNANGVPDPCEYAGVALAADQAPFGGSAPLVATFTEVDLAITDVRLEIEVRADLAAANKFVQVRVGGTLVSTLWVVGGAACPATPSVATVIVPAATFNAAADNGSVAISLEPSSPVNIKSCVDSFAGLTLRYVSDQPFSDCLGNGQWDDCDLYANPSLDCDGNGLIDPCEIAANPSLDCDGNGLIDACEISADPWRDCNGNGVLDLCEIAANPSLDCDGNGVLDACDIAADSSIDCDGNGLIDQCEIAAGPWLDCNSSGVLDVCEIAAEPSLDCDGNGVRDACEVVWMPGLDCNVNGIPDACEIALDPSLDSNGDGTLDSCAYAVGDLTLDSVVDGADLAILLLLWGVMNPEIGDLNGDGLVDGQDLGVLLIYWGPVPLPPVVTGGTVGGLGGGTFTITGRHLGTVQSVTIGGVSATEVTVVDGNTITAIAPPGNALGQVELRVTTAFGTATLPGGFGYIPVPEWATLLEAGPDASVVTDAALRAAIIATGLPWRVRDNASGIEMLLVPSGTFMMGCSPSDQYGCLIDEYPVHEVTLTQAFYLGRYEVTQAQWTAVMGSNPSFFQGASAEVPAEQVANRPVEVVSWDMIQDFEAQTVLRLPTEAEWEYACRAGTTMAFNLPPEGTNDDGLLGQLAWINSNAAQQTRPVGQKLANNLGFHDMHGNVLEWVEDWYGSGYYAKSPEVDPTGPTSGADRVFRGGSWFGNDNCRASVRGRTGPGFGYGNVGFRAARTP